MSLWHLRCDFLGQKETIADSSYVNSANSYKYYFSQWGVNKSIPGTVKDSAILALGKRIRDSNSTPAVRYNGQEIDKKRLRRHISDTEKKREDADSNIQLSNNV